MNTKVLKVDPDSPDREAIQFAAALLRDGGLVLFPTETVYGIGANYLDKKAIDKLYEVKKRPKNKPFTIHISSLDTLRDMHCDISPLAKGLIKNFWPGPLTIILPLRECTHREWKNSSTPGVYTPGVDKLGFRMPANKIAKALIEESGVPVVAPSANISGEKPPASAEEITKELDGKIDLILDGGKTEFQKESTIIDITDFPYKILRKGAIPEEEIRRLCRKVT